MLNADFLSPIYLFMLESALECAIIYLTVRIIWRVFSVHNPAMVSRFLLLPLVIPVLLSPFLHVLFPQLEQLALIVQIERALPILERMQHSSLALAPVLLIVFACLLVFNVMQWLIVSLYEVLRCAETRSIHSPTLERSLARLAAKFGVTDPRLIISQRRPCAAHIFGWRQPIISLGQHWSTHLDDEELEAVLAHELAHFKRGDNWQNMIAKVCRDLMFFNPLVHYIYRQLVMAREEASDDLALQVTHKPLALASCLLKFWRVRQPASIGLPFSGQGGGVEQRITRLMADDYRYQGDREWNGLFYGLSITLTVLLSVV
jgi:beta-lactamase regulating signal transducer with metallopeptidase domain